MGIIRKIKEANQVIAGSGAAIDKRRQQDELARRRQQKTEGKR